MDEKGSMALEYLLFAAAAILAAATALPSFYQTLSDYLSRYDDTVESN